MLNRILAIVLTLICLGSARGKVLTAIPAGDSLRAYWLEDKDPETADRSNPLLLITHVSLHQLSELASLRDESKGQSGNEGKTNYILDAPAIYLETHERDSIWNDDDVPVKEFTGRLTPNSTEETIVAGDREYQVRPADLEDVARLLENPEGNIPLHRKVSAAGGAGRTLRALSLLVRRQMMIRGEEVEPADQEPAADRIRIANWNVLYGFNHSKAVDEGSQWLAEQKLDVAAFQELNGITENKLKEYAKNWGHDFAVTHKVGGFPVGLTSKESIEVIEKKSAGFHHGFLHCKTYGIHFFVVHFWPGKSNEVDEILSRASPYLARNEKVIILGDFNGCSRKDEAFLIEHAKLRERDYTFVDRVEDQGYVDLVHKHDPKAKISCPSPITIPRWSKDTEELRRKEYRIDFVFADPELAKSSRYGTILRDREIDVISDHYPVLIELEMEQWQREMDEED